ncbi:MAG: protein kinase domain-containing protein [Thermoanaerobaculia bacterium]
MTLAAGTRLGPYEILSPLGAGGMGEVYKARDTRLGREIAVKVLPPELTTSDQARQRFEREARTISQLSHPHICALYDVGNEDGIEYLVMELLEGQTLSDRLAKGPLPMDQALRSGAEIADALEKAHRQGIVHRDLKPANVMLTSSGVKVLDFGLARAIGPSPSAGSLTALPTETPLTEAGMVLGTVQYMAPEQLEGKDADARTDIFALGLVLYEMATGRKAFSGATRASLIGAILRDEPAPISREQPLAPRALDRVVSTCLAKEPEERWQTARDVALQLEGIRQDRSAAEPAIPAPVRRRRFAVLPWAIAATGAALAVFGLTSGLRPRSRPPAMRTLLLPPPGTIFNYGPNSAPAAVSPDGRRLAFGTRDADGSTRLWVREMDAPEPYPVPGGEGALFPFWSPDSRFIGFFARGALKVIEASRSPQPPRLLANDVLEPRGGSWGEDGTILYSPGNLFPLMRVAAAGGKPVPATRLESGERSHRWPRFLPGGRRFLYEVRKPSDVNAPLSRATFVGSLDDPGTRLVLSDDTGATFASPGYLLFGRALSLMAAACDPKSLAIRGEPFVLASNVETFNAPGAPFFSVSENLLVYPSQASVSPTRMVWLDRSGKEISTVGPAGQYLSFALSADGHTAVTSQTEHSLPPDIWMFDTGVGRGIRLTRDAVAQLIPVISPDRRRIFFSAYSRGPWNLWETTPRGGPDLKTFLESETTKTANDVSPDGRYLLYREFNPGTLGDLKVVPLTGDRQPRTFVGTADDETNGDFSPDGRWVAYASDESGRKEIYAASFPDAARRLRVTSEGGSRPRWSPDGKELFYVRSGQLLAVPVGRKGDELTFGQGRPLFALPLFSEGDPGFDVVTRYDVAPDGRFLALLRAREEAPDPLVVVLNWAEPLKKP